MKRIISVGVIVIIQIVVWLYAQTVEIHSVPKTEISMKIDSVKETKNSENPGFVVSGSDDVLPQLYLLHDGRIILYAMGEYFLLEKE